MILVLLICIGTLFCVADSRTTALNGVEILKKSSQQIQESSINRIKRQGGFGLTFGSWPAGNSNRNNGNGNPFLNNCNFPETPNNNFIDQRNQNNGGIFSPNNRRSTQPPPTSPTTAAVAVPGMATTRSPCEDRCQATTQFDPVCADNSVTYTNIYWFRCAQRCGKRINVQYRGACPRSS